MEEYRRRFLRLSVWIYFFSLVLVFAVAWFMPEGQVHWPSVYAILGIGLLSVLVLAAVPWQRYRPDWLLIITTLAVGQISALTIVTGGDDSPFFSLYFFIIILSGAYFSGPALFASIFLVILGSAAYHLFERPIHLNLDHLISIPVYVATAVVTNFLFKDLHRRSAQARRQSKQLESLYEASSLLYAESASAAVFHKLLDVARRATDARYAAIRTFDESGALAAFYHSGLSDEELAVLKDPPGDVGVLGAITATGPPVRLADLTHDPSHKGFPAGHPAMKSLLCVPVTSGFRMLGKLYLTEKAGGRPFTEEDEELVAALARDAAVAIEKARLLEEVRVLATTDGLTRLYNRRAFQDRLKEEVDRASRYGRLCSLLMVDVDNFKTINDTFGHQTGDVALSAIAEVVRMSVRLSDYCTRYGGEEFAVLLPETDRKGALLVAERLRSGVEKLPFHTPGGHELSLTVSIGVAVFPQEADSPDALVGVADAALYQAKRLGKNRVGS